jgi:tetratricopeptide (TPR) repeat protein
MSISSGLSEPVPENPATHVALGRKMLGSARFDEAAELFERALALDPRHLEAFLGRADAMRRLNRPQEALASYDRALAVQPESAQTHLSRGAVLMQLLRWDEALSACDQAIVLGFDHPEVYLNRVTPLLRLQRYDLALASCDHAISRKPQMVAAHILRGITLLEMRRPTEASDSLERAVALDPASADAYLWLGRAQMDLGLCRDALASYDRALRRRPDFADAHNNRGIALFDLGDWNTARASYETALSIQPDSVNTLCNLGILHQAQNHPDAALALYEKAIALDPEFAKVRYNRATVWLLAGDYARGWAELEWRHRTPYGGRIDRERNLAEILPPKDSLRNRSVFIYSEWGLGDAIQFCRFVIPLAQLGARVHVQAPAALTSLLERLGGVESLIHPGDPIPHFDYHCPMLSLPLFFGTTLATIPTGIPYLSSGPARTSQWQGRLGAPSRARVGLAWSGGFRPNMPESWPVNGRRNIPLAKLTRLKNSDIEFYSLQKGQPAESELAGALAANWDGPQLLDFTGELHDFADTAALIEQLDLVITVDTSIAHLAGALGKPVWILNRFDTCWRWMLGRSDTAWYPTATIYRQPHPGDWAGVIERVRADLARWSASSNGQSDGTPRPA